MKEIKSIIDTQSGLDLLLKSKFYYKDTLPVKASEIHRENSRYLIMKYYEGSVQKDEHMKFKESCEGREFLPVKVYDYIFRIQENGMNEISTQYLDEKTIDEVAELWLIQPEKFEYREYFEKLIFLLYCEKQDKRFRRIALNAYEAEASTWAKNYIMVHKEYRELFLLKRKEDENYQKRYGIEEMKESESGGHAPEPAGNKSGKECGGKTDWITEKFGG